MLESANEPSDYSEEDMVNELTLLNIYRESIPSEFDAGFIELQRGIDFQCRRAIQSSGLRPAFSRGAMQGNQSRSIFENEVISLAEKLGMKAGSFKSGGGSTHVKISTESIVLSVHTVGDDEGKLSRFTRYKKNLAASNPIHLGNGLDSKKSESYQQGQLLRDTDIGLPEILPPGVYLDERIYFTISVPRLFHARSDIHLVVPSRMYSGAIAEFNYFDIRDSCAVETEIQLYTENTIEPRRITLRRNDVNEIRPKRPNKDQSREKE